MLPLCYGESKIIFTPRDSLATARFLLPRPGSAGKAEFLEVVEVFALLDGIHHLREAGFRIGDVVVDHPLYAFLVARSVEMVGMSAEREVVVFPVSDVVVVELADYRHVDAALAEGLDDDFDTGVVAAVAALPVPVLHGAVEVQDELLLAVQVAQGETADSMEVGVLLAHHEFRPRVAADERFEDVALGKCKAFGHIVSPFDVPPMLRGRGTGENSP